MKFSLKFNGILSKNFGSEILSILTAGENFCFVYTIGGCTQQILKSGYSQSNLLHNISTKTEYPQEFDCTICLTSNSNQLLKLFSVHLGSYLSNYYNTLILKNPSRPTLETLCNFVKYRKIHTKHPPPWHFRTHLNQGGGCLQRCGISITFLACKIKFQEFLRDFRLISRKFLAYSGGGV